MHQPRRHLSKMYIMNYAFYIREKAAFEEEKSEPIGDGHPHRPSPPL